jgi:hypothetical protein
MVRQWSPVFDAILQAWIGAQSICSQFCWFMLWLRGISEKNVLALEQICRQHFHHLASWQGNSDRTSEPPHWTPQHDTIQNGRRRRRPHSIPAHWHLQKNGQLLRSQSLSETHPYHNLYFPSPPKRERVRVRVRERVRESAWVSECPGLSDAHNPRTGIPHHHFQWYWIQPSAHTMILDTALSRYNDTGYSPQQIQWSLKTIRTSQTTKTNDKPTSTALIPYIQTTYGWLGRMLANHNIKSVSDCILQL